ncbi:TlpA family protein disulfide reductase [Litoribacter alkaliphilus]|uniref:TlpA family protein disulfide reductase n=1 Tax=Litoribacter ruber TaxID=702568 RepID=A0AAP2CKW7_9BACT|nr:TlpA disulfide reductase family protein [Litoribacter alkaliphilus]MBS9525654.1 TlpA family protein disulfide reductase [Litoribacter alkaliphilus]
MKKRTILSFLALLCLVGSGIYLYGERVAHPDFHQSGPSGSDAAFPGSSGEPAPVVIYGELANRQGVDSLWLRVYDPFIGKSSKTPPPRIQGVDVEMGRITDGVFPGKDLVFQVETAKVATPIYLDLNEGNQPLLDRVLAFPGDSVRVRIERDMHRVLFDGPQALFYKVQYELAAAEASQKFGTNPILLTHDAGNRSKYGPPSFEFGRKLNVMVKGREQLDWFKTQLEVDFFESSAYQKLQFFEDKLSSDRLKLLEADLWGRHYLPIFQSYYFLLKESLRGGNIELVDEMRSFYESQLSGIQHSPIDHEMLVYAADFQDWLIIKARIEGVLEEKSVIEQLVKNSSPMADRALVRYILNETQEVDLDRSNYMSLLKQVKEPVSQELLRQFGGRVVSGEEAYPFRLPDAAGDTVTLESLRGKWLFVDFWYTGCGGCVQFYQQVVSRLEERYVDDARLEILSINTDTDSRRWKKSIQSNNYTSDHAINLSTGGNDHPLLGHYNIQAFPYQVLIDPEGKVYKTGDLRKPANELIHELDLLINLQP